MADSTVNRLWSLLRQLQGGIGGTNYLSAPFVLAAGTAGFHDVAHGLGVTPTFVYGGVTGTSSVEVISWGWTADAGNVRIWAMNNGGSSATVEVRFRAAP